MSVNSPSDIKISDIFKINPYEYFFVTSIEEDKIEGIIRDGIYVVGSEPRNETYDASSIISQVNNDEWQYKGKFSYEGEDINGNPIK